MLSSPETEKRNYFRNDFIIIFYFYLILFFFLLLLLTADGLYFPTSVVNVTLPKWETLPRGLPPLVRLHAVADWNSQPADDIKYAIVLETTSRLFIIDGNELRLNEESFFTDDIGKVYFIFLNLSCFFFFSNLIFGKIYRPFRD